MATKTDVSSSTCVDGYGSAIGMPQLCTDWAGNQVFWLVITLVAIFFVLSRLALPRISAVISERQGTITNDLAAAENLKSEAVQAEEAYKKALEDARLEASKIIEAAKVEIKQELDVAIQKADADISVKVIASEDAISEIRKDALANVKSLAKDITSELVKVLGGKVDAKALTAVINKKMKG
ncbi:F0F1 ATP synthase subunit B' [Paracoccaceae bacterium]|nr:F0F1 ATP synthase subunit B' [Paracoccaceae bacterium]